MRRILTSLAVFSLAAPALADGPGVVAAEVGCGYVGGVGAALGGIVVGNIIVNDPEFAGGGFVGLLLAYPAGAGLGAWGAGEIWGDDLRHDWATAAAAVGASYTAPLIGVWVGGVKGLIIGMLVAPATATAAYNLVKRTDRADPDAHGAYFSAAFTF